MKPSDYYREAAELVFNSASVNGHLGCCAALLDTVYPNVDKLVPLKRDLQTVFAPDVMDNSYWFGTPYVIPHVHGTPEMIEHNLNHRIFALLFMAEISKDN